MDEVTVTEITLEETADASGLLENALTALAKVCPFCSNWTRWVSGVDELKNASQFVLIAATSDAEAMKKATADCKAEVKEKAKYQEISWLARHKMVKKCVQETLANHH